MAARAPAIAANPADLGEARAYLASAFRISGEFLGQRGCTAAGKEKVSKETAQLIDDPPFPFAWIPARAMGELESALALVAGRQACVDLGILAGRKLGGSIIQPVLKMATALFGN